MEREAPGWHPAVAALMKTAPKGSVVHWKLMWRDLCEDWASPAGHVVQVGDSAHSFLPTSGNGASQAMEDAITLATCLHLGGLSNLSIATKVYNKLRFVDLSSLLFLPNPHAKHTTTNLRSVDTKESLVRKKCHLSTPRSNTIQIGRK